jgi:hypothetical protein
MTASLAQSRFANILGKKSYTCSRKTGVPSLLAGGRQELFSNRSGLSCTKKHWLLPEKSALSTNCVKWAYTDYHTIFSL